jgi:putative MATE family efflux protein
MYYVAAAGVINVGLDWLLVGPLGMGAGGAAVATVASQGISVLLGMIALKKYHSDAFPRSLRPDGEDAGYILGIGLPIALQEGLIQVSFLVITMIANSRGVEVAAAVGIVEKVISFLFLVPSAMLSTVSALCAQNAGAGRHDRSRQVLRIGCMICAGFGAVIFALCQPLAPWIVSLFVKNGDNVETVVRLGGQYLRTYSVDCMIAGIHFCFSGFFSAYGKSVYSFLHNIISIITFRIPGAWIAAVYFPATLYPMGLAAPMGSLLSVLICLFLYRRMKLKG